MEKEKLLQEMMATPAGEETGATGTSGGNADPELDNDADPDDGKFSGLENLDVGSKFRMFEKGNEDDEEDDDMLRPPSSRLVGRCLPVDKEKPTLTSIPGWLATVTG